MRTHEEYCHELDGIEPEGAVTATTWVIARALGELGRASAPTLEDGRRLVGEAIARMNGALDGVELRAAPR